jgi:hypothetical protein
LFFNVKKNKNNSKNKRKGRLTIKRPNKSGEDNKQPTIKDVKKTSFLLLTIELTS